MQTLLPVRNKGRRLINSDFMTDHRQKTECILLVDDDPASNYLARALIEEIDASIQVCTSRNGQEALDFLDGCLVSGNCPDLVLLDLNMPGMDGFTFLDALQSSYNPPKRIFVLTSSYFHGDVEKAASYPISGYLIKPVSEKQLREIIYT